MELQFEVSKSCPGVNFYTSATVRHYPTGFFKKKRILEVLMGGAKRSPSYHHGGAVAPLSGLLPVSDRQQAKCIPG